MIDKVKDQIVSLLIDHSRLIYEIISDMGVFFNGWSDGGYETNKENLDKKKSKMQLNEEDADVIKIKLIKEFSEAGNQGLGDYVALVLRMDNVINSALEFTDVLTFIPVEKTNEEIKKLFYSLINTIIKMTDTLKTTIKCLRDNPNEVLEHTTTIHELENDVDKTFRDFMNLLYSDDSIEIRLLLRLRDSVLLLEELADRIHDIADVIRVLRYQ